MDEVKLCPWLLFVPWSSGVEGLGPPEKKIAVEWIDFEKITSNRMVFGASCYPQKRSYFRLLLCFFCGRHQVLHVFLLSFLS